MKIKVLGSGSSGNCYILQDENETIILECGIRYKEILSGLNYDLSNVVGCLVTHEHKDHSKAILDLNKNGIDVYASIGTFKMLNIENHRTKIIKSEQVFKLGGFTILPFNVKHDAKEPLGFLINHNKIGSLLFITDTYYCEYIFKDINHILVECNFRKEILDENIAKGVIPVSLRNRIVKSHFELSNTIDFLKSSDLSRTETVTLIHLSSQNSDERYFKDEVEKNIGIPVKIARKGLEVFL